ncbi:MAG: choice-of-anchor Q domain-containing protein [Anaerolineae bacterium]
MKLLDNTSHKIRKLTFISLFLMALFSGSLAATTQATANDLSDKTSMGGSEGINLGNGLADISATMNVTISGEIKGINLTGEPIAINDAIYVDSKDDLGDVNPGNGLCQASNGLCTLRAAIDEANGRPGIDLIRIPAGNYPVEGQLVIKDSVTISGEGKHDTLIDGQNITEILKVQTTEMLVCDSTNNSIVSYDIHGKPNKNFVPPEANGLSDPMAIAIGPDRYLYVTTKNAGVFKYHPNGSFAGMFIASPPAGSLFTDGAFGPSNTLGDGFYLADYIPKGKILRYGETNGNNLISTITDDELSQPLNLAFDDYYVYVTDPASNNIQRYYAPSEVLAGIFIEGLNSPQGLVFKGNAVYVANGGTNSVLKFDTNGNFLETFISPGSGGLDTPTDIGFGPDGDFYVISSKTKEILRFNGATGAFKDVFIKEDNKYLSYPTCFEWQDGKGNGPVVLINQLTIQNGLTQGPNGNTSGLKINHGSTVFLRDTVIRNNTSSIDGGGISNQGTLRIYDSEILDNYVPAGGNGATSRGGGIYNSGFLELRRSLVANNFATRGGGIFNNTGNFGPGESHLINSTISKNKAIGAGGGIFNIGSTMFINHSTITQNQAKVIANTVESIRVGGGIYNLSPAVVHIGNSIVAGNSDNRTQFAPDFSPDCFNEASGNLISEGQNMIGVLSSNCYFSEQPNDQIGNSSNPLDPMLGSLLNRVHMPLKDSPAIDNGLSVSKPFKFYTFTCLEGDQNKQSRPIDGDLNISSRCDIGAAEYFPDGTYEVVVAEFLGDKEGLEISSFGSIELGGFSEKQLVITNNTDKLVEVKDLQLPDGFETADRFIPFAVEPGERAELTIMFNPADYGSYKGGMSLMIGEQRFQWTLVGEATKPDGR